MSQTVPVRILAYSAAFVAVIGCLDLHGDCARELRWSQDLAPATLRPAFGLREFPYPGGGTNSSLYTLHWAPVTESAATYSFWAHFEEGATRVVSFTSTDLAESRVLAARFLANVTEFSDDRLQDLARTWFPDTHCRAGNCYFDLVVEDAGHLSPRIVQQLRQIPGGRILGEVPLGENWSATWDADTFLPNAFQELQVDTGQHWVTVFGQAAEESLAHAQVSAKERRTPSVGASKQAIRDAFAVEGLPKPEFQALRTDLNCPF